LKSSDSGLKLLGFVLSSSRAQQLCEEYYMNKVVFFMLMQVLQLCRKHEVTIDSSYASLVVAVCVLVGFARSLDPELSIMDAAIPCLFFYNLVGRIPGGIYG
jgi:predicted unusual protein kinase regulating ubiquinone biosynthesis (AarF/ABC1/UbiB family)